MLQRLSRFALYAAMYTPLLLIKPLFFPFISGKAIGFRFFVELAALFFLIHLLTQLRHPEYLRAVGRRLSHPFILCIVTFAAAAALTALIGVNPTQSFWSNFERGEGAFQILHYALFFVLIMLHFDSRDKLKNLLVFNIAVSVPMSLFALLQLITPIDGNNLFVIAPGERVSGTLGNPSYLAAYLIFTLVFLFYYIIRCETIKHLAVTVLGVTASCGTMLYLFARDWRVGVDNSALDHLFFQNAAWFLGIAVIVYLVAFMYQEKFQKFFLPLLFVFELFILLKTGTRGAFLGLIIGLLVIMGIALIRTRSKKIRTTIGVLAAGAVLVLGSFFMTSQAPFWHRLPVFGRLINLNSAVNDIRPRLWTWQSGLAAFAERPVAGWGAENFPNAFDKYYNPRHYGIESFFDRTHNIILEYAVTGGLLVLLPWFALFWYYYRLLRKREKDFWQSVLVAMPIIYLVQGFFLFDTLPIYIAFFVFLTFVAHTNPHADAPLESPHGILSGVQIATAAMLVVGTGALVYYTSLLPLRKNLAIVEAVREQSEIGVTPTASVQGALAKFDRAMDLPSPIGQDEAVGMYQKFILSLVENVGQNPEILKNEQARAEIRQLVLKGNYRYDQYRTVYPGLKAQYVNGGINLRAGAMFNYPDLLNRGKELFNNALTKAPTRLEFIRVLIDLAAIERDQASYELWSRRAHQYRPDIFPAVTP